MGKFSVGMKKPRRQAAVRGCVATRLSCVVAALLRAAPRYRLGEDQAELVVTGGRGDEGGGQGQHVDAVLVGVGRVADVQASGLEGDDVAGGVAVDEGQLTEGAVRESRGEVVLLGDGRSFDDDGAGGGTVGDQHLLGAVHQLAVDGGDYLVATLLIFSTWSIADKYIKPSKLYDYADSHLPSVMNEVKSEIVKLLEKVN